MLSVRMSIFLHCKRAHPRASGRMLSHVAACELHGSLPDCDFGRKVLLVFFIRHTKDTSHSIALISHNSRVLTPVSGLEARFDQGEMLYHNVFAIQVLACAVQRLSHDPRSVSGKAYSWKVSFQGHSHSSRSRVGNSLFLLR